eukprot:Hpha_TRINITY_DN15911_c2_g1::TRINITY_DN15911_c2_g1_i8::g.72679::m.72679
MGGERAFLEIDVHDINDARSEAVSKRQRAKFRELYVAERAKLKAALKKKVLTKPAKAPKKPKTTTRGEKKKLQRPRTKLVSAGPTIAVPTTVVPTIAVAPKKADVSKPTKAAVAFAKVSHPPKVPSKFQLRISASGLRWARLGEENPPDTEHTHPGLALLLRCLKPPAPAPVPVAPPPVSAAPRLPMLPPQFGTPQQPPGMMPTGMGMAMAMAMAQMPPSRPA